MSEVEFLDLEDLLSMVRALGIGPVRDVGLLDSAAARPRASAFGEDAYGTIDLKAAALVHSLARNHALVDGNKRLAWLAVVVFLDLNDREVEVLTWVARGKTSLEIAGILGLTKRTVDFHIDNARNKLGASTRTEAVIKATTGRLIEP